MNLPHPNPFVSEDDPAQPASVGYRSVSGYYYFTSILIFYYYYYFYRYLKWMLGDKIGLVARCEYDAVMATANGQSFINIKALNEWDSKVRIYNLF